MRSLFSLVLFVLPFSMLAQFHWNDVSDSWNNVPTGVKLFDFRDSVDGQPVVAFAAVISLKEKRNRFTTAHTNNERLTPQAFYEREKKPFLVVNGTFFSFQTNKNLNVLVKDGKLTANNVHDVALNGRDSGYYAHPFRSAIGIFSNRTADVAWIYTDSVSSVPFASQKSLVLPRSKGIGTFKLIQTDWKNQFQPWPVQTAIGGGPVLIQNGRIDIYNNEERMFMGKAIADLHPRTAMGYTNNGELVILVVEGRHKNISVGVSLIQLAAMMKSLGCVEALNLDGGGSTCMLIQGKPVIRVSDLKDGEPTQRPVPGVFMVYTK